MMRELLGIRQFRLIWLSRTISTTGSALTVVAMALAVLRIGGSVSDLGVILTAGAVTEILLMLIGGVWADRLPRGALMVGVDSARFAVVGGLAVLLLTGHARIYHFVIVSVLSAGGRALYRPATVGLVASSIPPQLLQRANALLAFSASSGSVVGPAVAGVIIAIGNPGWVYAIDAATFAMSALLLLRVEQPAAKPSRAAFWAELRDGWAEVRSRTWFWSNLVTHGLWNFGFTMIFVLGPVTVTGTLLRIPAWALFSMCITAGSLAGSFAAMRLRVRRPLVSGNLALVAGAAPFLAIMAGAPTLVVVAAAALASAGLAILSAMWSSTVQQLVPGDRLSRVTAYDWVASLSITPLAYTAAAPLHRAVGTAATMLICAATIAIPSALIVLTPGVRSVRRRPDGTVSASPLDEGEPTATPRLLKATSG